MEECITEVFSIISENTFKSFLLDTFLEQNDKKAPASFLRLAHIVCMLHKYNSMFSAKPLCIEMLDYIKNAVNDGTDVSYNFVNDPGIASFLFSKDLQKIPTSMYMTMLKYIERDTRGQANNPLWHMLRQNSITASKIFSMYVNKKINTYDSMLRYCSDAVNSGLKHEQVIKDILNYYVTKKNETISGNIGFLVDPASCILGASLDYCTGLSVNENNLIVVSKEVAIYEIKYRHKYVKEKSDPVLAELVRECTEQSFANFILSHAIPAIEYRTAGSIPSSQEFLLTYNDLYRPKKRLRTCLVPELLKEDIKMQLYLNEEQKSTVIIFGHKEEEYIRRGEICKKLYIYERARFTVDVFINPKHPYYFQILLQHYVMTKFYMYDNSDYARFNNSPTLHIVSAIFRRKNPDEIYYVINNTEYCDEEVPVCVIVTPVVVDYTFTSKIITELYTLWQRDIKESTDIEAWVPDAVKEYRELCVRPLTP